MKLKKLPWAGLLVENVDTRILIDPLGGIPRGQDKPLAARLGMPLETLVPFSELGKIDGILVTHVHPDHYDPESIRKTFGNDIPLFVPGASMEFVKQDGFVNVQGAEAGDEFILGSLKIAATYSVDGYATPQVAWVVEGENQRILHCGDTLWNGSWWKISRLHREIDVACLPINGAILKIPGLPKQSKLHACLTPEEAVEAAHILGAKVLIPIHYNTFHNPPYYLQTPNALERLTKAANERSVTIKIMSIRDTLDVSSLAAV